MVVEETEVYRERINLLKGLVGRVRIQVRVDRLVHGNPENHCNLTQGISELKVDFGPGYRVYYAKRGEPPPDLASLHISRRIRFSGEMWLNRLDDRPQRNSGTIAA
jgi:putative addiction module killer protein